MSVKQENIINEQQQTINRLHRKIAECRGEEVSGLLDVITEIRDVSGLGIEPDLAQLPQLIREMRQELDHFKHFNAGA